MRRNISWNSMTLLALGAVALCSESNAFSQQNNCDGTRAGQCQVLPSTYKNCAEILRNFDECVKRLGNGNSSTSGSSSGNGASQAAEQIGAGVQQMGNMMIQMEQERQAREAAEAERRRQEKQEAEEERRQREEEQRRLDAEHKQKTDRLRDAFARIAGQPDIDPQNAVSQLCETTTVEADVAKQIQPKIWLHWCNSPITFEPVPTNKGSGTAQRVTDTGMHVPSNCADPARLENEQAMDNARQECTLFADALKQLAECRKKGGGCASEMLACDNAKKEVVGAHHDESRMIADLTKPVVGAGGGSVVYQVSNPSVLQSNPDASASCDGSWSELGIASEQRAGIAAHHGSLAAEWASWFAWAQARASECRGGPGGAEAVCFGTSCNVCSGEHERKWGNGHLSCK